MTSIIDFLKLKNLEISKLIYIGKYRDYYLNVVSVLTNINIYYYLDLEKDYNTIFNEPGSTPGITVLVDGSLSFNLGANPGSSSLRSESLRDSVEDPRSSEEELENLFKKYLFKYQTRGLDYKIIYKDIKTGEYKLGNIISEIEPDTYPEPEIQPSYSKDIIEDDINIEEKLTFDLYEFELIDKIISPIFNF